MMSIMQTANRIPAFAGMTRRCRRFPPADVWGVPQGRFANRPYIVVRVIARFRTMAHPALDSRV